MWYSEELHISIFFFTHWEKTVNILFFSERHPTIGLVSCFAGLPLHAHPLDDLVPLEQRAHDWINVWRKCIIFPLCVAFLWVPQMKRYQTLWLTLIATSSATAGSVIDFRSAVFSKNIICTHAMECQLKKGKKKQRAHVKIIRRRVLKRTLNCARQNWGPWNREWQLNAASSLAESAIFYWRRRQGAYHTPSSHGEHARCSNAGSFSRPLACL